MRHFMAQFGPALKWPWTKLMDVPELTDTFLDKIASQSDEQAGNLSIRELEQIRDDGLVAILQGLKGVDWGAGSVFRKQEKQLFEKSALSCPVHRSLHPDTEILTQFHYYK